MRLGDPIEIGRLMKRRREELGFTQEEMAAAVGLSPITIMRIELGRVQYVHTKTAKALEVPRKIIKRARLVTELVDENGHLLPPGPATPVVAPKEIVSGDASVVGIPMPTLQRKLTRARRAKLEARIRVLEHPSRPRKFLLWLASKV